MRSNLFTAAAALTVAILTVLPTHAASTPAFAFTSANLATYDSSTAELGYDFTVGSAPLSVTALGYNNDGFNGTHAVQIFNVATKQAVSGALATVTTVGGDSTSNTFTYTNLASPVTLAANTEYQIISQFFVNEHYFIQASGLTENPDLTFVTSAYDDYGNVPAVPTYATNTSSSNNPGDFGPNLLVAPVAVTPEPSSMLLLGTGILFVGGIAAKRFV